MRLVFVIIPTLLALCGLTESADAQGVYRPPEKEVPVKARTSFSGFSPNSIMGVVEKIDEGSMTVRRTGSWTGDEASYQYFALDLHKEGKYLETASGPEAYFWSDLKKGDTIQVKIVKDAKADKEYAISFCIQRRAGAKLPLSQKPKEDGRFATASMTNDILNGEDVSEELIRKLFPPEFKFDARTGTRQLRNPGGLPAEYRRKLDDLRGKLQDEKEKDLKAIPSEKK